jgi:hypothetical protein
VLSGSATDGRFLFVHVTRGVIERVEEVVRIARGGRPLAKGTADEADPVVDTEQARQCAGRFDPRRTMLEPDETASAEQRPRDTELASASPDVDHAADSQTVQPLRRSLHDGKRCPVLR